jgi:hypothetical protein
MLTPGRRVNQLGGRLARVFGGAHLLANPLRPPEVPYIFAQSMAMVIEALGATIDDLKAKVELATATKEIAYSGGLIPVGAVAGQHYEWTAWSRGTPVMTYHCFWVMGPDDIEPQWNPGETGYRVRFEGNPPMEILLRRPASDAGAGEDTGMPWTSMAGVNAIPPVCDASPGMVTHLGLGLFGPRGVLRL